MNNAYVAYHFELTKNHENTDWWKNGGKQAWGNDHLVGITYLPEFGERFAEKLSAAGDWTGAVTLDKMDANAYEAYKVKNWID